MRGSAPLLVAGVGIIAFGERPTATTWLGIGLISGGIASLAFAHSRRHGSIGRVLGWALATASMIAGYTLVDAAGARIAGDAVGYVAWMFFLEGLPFAALVFAWRREAFVHHVRTRWQLGLAGGALSALSYGIAVWAMTRAPVAAVAALRETSVVFAALIGVVLLKEAPSRARWAGIAAVVAGAVVLHG
jgi:drug/metabolite transporter (DMT)-like permease